MMDAIVFEENGFPVELGTAREIERAVTAGRLRPDTLVRTATEDGAQHLSRADEVSWLRAFLGLRDGDAPLKLDVPLVAEASLPDALSQTKTDIRGASRPSPWSRENIGAPVSTQKAVPTTTPERNVEQGPRNAYVDPVGFLAHGAAPLARFADFKGRSSPKEFWTFMLLMPIGLLLAVSMAEPSVVGLISLALILPTLAVAVRRLHDQDRTGWLLLIGLVPYIGWLVLMVVMMVSGTPGRNRFGANPIREDGGTL